MKVEPVKDMIIETTQWIVRKIRGPKVYTSKNGTKISKTDDGTLTFSSERDTDKGTKQSTYTYEDK